MCLYVCVVYNSIRKFTIIMIMKLLSRLNCLSIPIDREESKERKYKRITMMQ